MIAEIFAIVAPIFICAGIGFGWKWLGYDYPSDFVSRLITYIGAPCLILYSLISHPLPFASMMELALLAVLVLLTGLLGYGLLLRCLKLDARVYLPPLLFPNSGNMGLPLALFAFGAEGMTLGLGYLLVMMIAQLSLGMVIIQGNVGKPLSIASNLAKQPMIYAMLLGLCMSALAWQLPPWLDNTLNLLSHIAIPMMLITLGVSLASLKMTSWRRSLSLSVVRIPLTFLITWLACQGLGIEGLARQVALLYAAMPSAVFNYLFAVQFKREPEQVAGIVVASTLLSVAVLPIILSLIMST